MLYADERLMQEVHAFDPAARTAIDLEAFVEIDHLLRRVDRELDLSFVHQLTAPCYSRLGRPCPIYPSCGAIRLLESVFVHDLGQKSDDS